jgi:ABC-type phosphate/phosphonate transport system ATPase subunit
MNSFLKLLESRDLIAVVGEPNTGKSTFIKHVLEASGKRYIQFDLRNTGFGNWRGMYHRLREDFACVANFQLSLQGLEKRIT